MLCIKEEVHQRSMIKRFYNCHLPEEVRIFNIPSKNIRVCTDKVVVYEVPNDELGMVLRHYSFFDRWFEINVSMDYNGGFITESGSIDWSFNCDICTPCFSIGDEYYNVDLELDILVGKNGKDYVVIDEEDFKVAVSNGSISQEEKEGAKKGVDDLIEIIEQNKLIGMLNDIYPFSKIIDIEPKIPMNKMDISKVLNLSPELRKMNYGKRIHRS
jgi:predicted RNA-binding protein associated with RNAse of E/G family